ncbi:hypothetical protein [Actinomadura spongiicola]|uniref:hypothetical protein n=1 Tax=Actinomadura spongiicola TaxID=2303421 RepID=UPI0013146B5A|nr:hypothetical protein [Actinomadura spongiicola]
MDDLRYGYLAKCTTAAPYADSGGPVTASCRASSSPLQNWLLSGRTVYLNVTVHP